jgi:drug/metabolite transporter (DMT)-like permease
MAVLLLGEQPHLIQWLGVPLTAAGAVLAAARFEKPDRQRRSIGPGLAFTVITVLAYGAYTVGLPSATQASTALNPREMNTVCTQPAALLIVLGGLNALGQLTRALALETAPAWLVGLVVSTSPAAVLATAVLVLHERVGPAQWLGIGLIIAGLALVAAG